jgi:glycine/D-amino acid oxidase-like deaminating enzyme
MPLAAEGIYCATGYNGNGMMLGSVAGKILSDLILKKDQVRYEKLFSPARIKPIDGFANLLKRTPMSPIILWPTG